MNITIDDFSAVFTGSGNVETSRTELIKQSTTIKRFGESALRNHPQRGSVASAMKLLQPEQLVAILHNTSKALQGNTSQLHIQQDANMPQLASEPYALSSLSQIASGADNTETSLTASARMMSLLGKINQLTGDVTLQKMVGQLKIFNAQLEGQSKTYGALADQLENHAQQWADDSDALAQAQSLVDGFELQVFASTEKYNQAQAKLQSLQKLAEQALQETGAVPPDLNKKIEKAKCAVTETYNNKERAVVHYNDALKNKLEPAHLAEITSKSSLENTKQQAQTLLGSVSIRQISAIENSRKEKNENAKSLSYLLAVISQLISESASNDLQAGAALKQKMAEEAAKSTEKKAHEFEIAQQKAADMQKTMGCIGKTIGWVITVIAVLAAIPTGGASLALAGVALALTAADEIYQAATGKSFIEQALAPLMESVIQPIIEYLSKEISSLFQAMGVDKATADLIGNIIGAVVAAIAIIAVALIGGSLAGSMLSGIGTKLAATSIAQTSRATMLKVMQKVMDNSLSQMFKRMASMMTRKFGSKNIFGEKAINSLKQSNNIAAGINTAIHTSLNITSSVYQQEADKLRANILECVTLQQLLNELMDRMVDNFSNRLSATNTVIENMATVAENQMQAGKYITHKIRNVAV